MPTEQDLQKENERLQEELQSAYVKINTLISRISNLQAELDSLFELLRQNKEESREEEDRLP